MTTVTIRVNALVLGIIVLLTAFGLMAVAKWLSTDAAAQPAHRESAWVMQTRLYQSNRGSTWDAYVLNVQTGDLFFVNQNKMAKVLEGEAKGAK